MKKPLQIMKKAGAVLLALTASFLVIRWTGIIINSTTPKGGINESMYVDINGTKQWISIYGEDIDNPVLLYLHGGPGSATSPVDYAFTRKWSDVYTVVTWDQRNCAMSYDKDLKDQIITADTMMEDGKEMTEFLLDHLDKDKITLLGHSWGSLYGANLALTYPQYYDAFIGAGQLIDRKENEKRFAKAASSFDNEDPKCIEDLKTIKSSYDLITDDYMEAKTDLLESNGYGVMKDGTDYNTFTAVIFNPSYSLRDYISYYAHMKGTEEQYDRFLNTELDRMSIIDKTDYEVPFYNINGDLDYQTSYDLAYEYFKEVNAPKKAFYTLEGGTHGLMMSRSEEFSDIVHEISKLSDNK